VLEREGFVTALLSKISIERGGHWDYGSGVLCKDKARAQDTSSMYVMPTARYLVGVSLDARHYRMGSCQRAGAAVYEDSFLKCLAVCLWS